MARGDRDIGRLVKEAWRLGARLDGWDEHFDLARWTTAAATCGIDMASYVAAIPVEQELPWSAIDCGVTNTFLLHERQKALLGEQTPDCRIEGCSGCGVCRTVKARIAQAPVSLVRPADAQVPQHSPQAAARYFHRIAYRKGEPIRFLGHRDMVSIFERAFLAARVPMEYSQGFNVHPRIGFGPPLPLGVMGENELMDVVTTQPFDFEPSRFGQWLPAGLEIVTSALSVNKPESISGSIAASRYRFVVPQAVTRQHIQERIAEILASSDVTIVNEKEGVRTSKQIRPLILELALVGEGGATFDAVLSSLQAGTCSPANLLSAMLPGVRFFDVVVTRMQCFGRRGGTLTAMV
jgi:radical SAM-linked protein